MTERVYEDIKRIIFARKIGECRTRDEWRRLYDEGGKDLPVDHLTSCSDCLDMVNELLGLPKLGERNPFDTISRDTGNDDPTDSTGASGGSAPKKEKMSADKSALSAK